MSEWLPIKGAPKDGTHVLLRGTQRPMSELKCGGPLTFSGYWDDIDSAWCSTGSTWLGPFYDATDWMPLPLPPPLKARNRRNR